MGERANPRGATTGKNAAGGETGNPTENCNIEADLGVGESVVIPVIEETATVEREIHEGLTVRVTKTIETETQEISAPVTAEEVEVTRVPVGRVIHEPAVVRIEDNTTIIPVVEEVPVVTTQLVLKEEIHLVRRTRKDEKSQQVTLKKEKVRVEKVPRK